MAQSSPLPNQTQTARPFRWNQRPQVDAPRVEWDEWFAWFAKTWKQDEHISIIGPTGTGKSTLALEILKIRTWRIAVVTKPEDLKLDRALARQHYVKIGVWPTQPPDDVKRYTFWPSMAGKMGRDAREKEQVVMRDMFTKVFEGPPGGRPGRWCLYLDEARYIGDPQMLGLMKEYKQVLIQGRAIRMSLVSSFQRPAWVPPEAYDQASYLFIAADNDRRNVQRFREIGGADGDQIAHTVMHQLGQFEWAFVDARPGEGDVKIIKAPKGL